MQRSGKEKPPRGETQLHMLICETDTIFALFCIQKFFFLIFFFGGGALKWNEMSLCKIAKCRFEVVWKSHNVHFDLWLFTELDWVTPPTPPRRSKQEVSARSEKPIDFYASDNAWRGVHYQKKRSTVWHAWLQHAWLQHGNIWMVTELTSFDWSWD